jgi:hypothetical protein
MMLAALLFAANTVVPREPQPPACPTMSPANVSLLHAALNGMCSRFTPEPCPAGIPIAFTAGAFEYSFACSVHTFKWDFGDGVTSNEMTTFHTFMPGTYNVTLRITNPYTVLTLTDRIVVEAVTTGDMTPNFTYSKDVNIVHFRIQNPSLIDAQWLFDFGDGTTATLTGATPPEVVHSYAKSGTYMVTLTVGTFFERVEQITITFPSRSRGVRH